MSKKLTDDFNEFKSRNISHKLVVRGVTWGGFRADHEYNLANDEVSALTMNDAKRIAGDFETLSDAVIIKREVTVNERLVKELT